MFFIRYNCNKNQNIDEKISGAYKAYIINFNYYNSMYY